jgi:hypothetical protein
VAGRQHDLLGARYRGARDPVADLERGLQRAREPRPQAAAHRQPVDHHLDRVLALLVEHRRVSGVDHLAVDPGPQEALLDHLLEELSVLALASRGERGE